MTPDSRSRSDEHRNFQKYYNWTGTQYNASYAWIFAMHVGDQYNRAKSANGYPLPVMDDDAGTAVNDGDINNKGIVDIGDVALAKRIQLHMYTPTYDEQARWDVAPIINGKSTPDGNINMSDYLILQRKLPGLITN